MKSKKRVSRLCAGFPCSLAYPGGSQNQINIAETPVYVKSGVKIIVLSNHICDLKNARGPII